jgi:kynurenine 3-monooxygenase
LELAGIAADIHEIAIPMYKRCMHALDGTLTYQPYGKEDQAIYSVSRGGLNQKLMNLADNYPSISYHFNRKCQDVNLDTNMLTFDNSETKETEHHQFDKIFASDGAFSAVRIRMQKSAVFDFSQKYLDHAYKELVIPANEDGTHKLDKNCLHIWPRGEFMMIALANLDGSFTCTLFFPLKGEKSFEALTTPDEVAAFFNKTFPDAVELMPTLIADYFENPTSKLIMDLALDNYIEMRDLTADPNFLLQKKIEAKFSNLYPEKWLPLYSQVTFSHIKYSHAYRNGKAQHALMQEILAIEGIHERWDEPFVMDKMLELVS